MVKRVLLGIVGAIILIIGYYFISPVFIEVNLNEAPPVSVEEVAPASATTSIENTTERPAIQNFEEVGLEDVQVEASNTRAAATIIGTAGHPASGSVRVIKTVDGDVIRMEDFKTINGPDLFVYLTTDLEATEFVDLGELKATEGNINYSVPEGVDISKYSYVVVWCKQFGVLFNYADITNVP